MLVSVGHNEVCAASGEDFNRADVRERTILLPYQHRDYGRERGLWRCGLPPWANEYAGRGLQNRLEYEERRPAMSHRNTVIFEKEDEGGYHVFCPTLPGCHTQSETIEEGVENIREAIRLYIGSLVEDGLPIPNEDILIKPIEIPV
jgi:predicted RNase H-like HicB family nuclease